MELYYERKKKDEASSGLAIKEKSEGFFVKFLEFILELIAAGDFVTDIIVLRQLGKTRHAMWFTITVVSIIMPFLISYVPFMIFLKERFTRASFKEELTCRLNILAGASLSPLILVYLMFMDIVFLFNETVLVPITYILRLLTCNCVDLRCLTRGIESSYEILFEMQ